MLNKYLVANTTREEREEIVREALSGCEGCDDNVSDFDWAIYQPYIDGEMELNECTRNYRTKYVVGGMEREERNGCGMGR